MTSSRLLDLTKTINVGTSEIHNYLHTNKLPFPSFHHGAPVALPPALLKVQDIVLDATNELQELLTNPVTAFVSYGNAENLVTLKALQSFDIANCFLPGQTSTFGRIAEQIGLNEQFTKALLRNAMTMRIFCEPEKGIVAHTCRSSFLRQSKYRSLLATGLEEMAPAALQTIEAVKKWPLLEEPTQTGFCLANETDQPMYKFIQQHPERAKRFADTMSILSSNVGLATHHVVTGFPWDTGRSMTVVDIGGSDGHVSIALAEAYPQLKFIVQDLSNTPSTSAESLSEELRKRITFMTHDFFEPQPVVADIYFFRWIFHNWPEKYCIKILQALVPALRQGSRIYISDICMPEPGTVPIWTERQLRRSALEMITFFNGVERDADGWKSLVEKADSRFRIYEIRRPEGSSLAMIEVVWQG